MESPGFSTQQQPSPDGGTIAQFILSSLAVAGLWGSALLVALLNLASGVQGTPDLQLSLTAFAFGALILPSAWLALKRLRGKPCLNWPILPAWWPVFALIVLLTVLAFGQFYAVHANADWLLLPVLNLLGVGLPAALLLYLGAQRLSLGSPQRAAGVFASGLVLGPGLILIAELIAMTALVIILSVWLSTQPGLSGLLEDVARSILDGSLPVEAAIEELLPALLNPWVLACGLFFIAVIVPILEEALKPIGVWLLGRRPLSPAEAFSTGILSGAGFAMFESLLLGGSGETWALVVVTRMGTTAVHILTAGLVAWGSRTGRLGRCYLGAVLFHGSWNGLIGVTVIASLNTVAPKPLPWPWLESLALLAPTLLGSLTLIALLGILTANRRLRKQVAQITPVDQPG